MEIIQRLLRRISLVVPAPQPRPSHRPPLKTPEEWHVYWESQGQPWRWRPEIDDNRQKELSQRQIIVPDIEKGVYPFKGVKLSRADVEWLLATHDNGRGPVNWRDENQRENHGLDLRGADLRNVSLVGLPLTRMEGGLDWRIFDWDEDPAVRQAAIDADTEQRIQACALLEGAQLAYAHLEGAILNGAHMRGVELTYAHMEKASLQDADLESACLIETHLQGANLDNVNLEKAQLWDADLRGCTLQRATLKQAELWEAHLEDASLIEANLEEAELDGAHLEGACLDRALLKRTALRRTYFDGVILENAVVSDEKHIGPYVVDARWGNANLAAVKWSQVQMLGEEYLARIRKDEDGRMKVKSIQQEEYEKAVRANRQLAIVLQAQGINEQAARFAYRAQVLQRRVFGFEIFQQKVKLKHRGQALGAWLFSWFLFLLAGYGYKPERSFLVYLLVIVGFTALYLGLDGHLAWYEAVVVSMTAFHGRGFSPSTFSPGDPLSIASAFEAFVGLIIEVTFIATLTQRFFNK